MAVFQPKAHDEFTLCFASMEVPFRAVPHPASRAFPVAHAMTTAKSTVYRVEQLAYPGDEYALKVLRAEYRDPRLEKVCESLDKLKDFAGLEVCDRQCLTPLLSAATLQKFSNLAYAILMPWMRGPSWFDILVNARDKFPFTKGQCFRLARNFAHVLAGMESAALAHCDLSPGNLIIDPDPENLSIELVDVEEVFGRNFAATPKLPRGTPGYQHRETLHHGHWSRHADRFAGALLISEMLGLFDDDVRKASYGESFFDPAELHNPQSRRFAMLYASIEGHSPDLARLFRRAWLSNTLEECPMLSEWHELLKHIQASRREYQWVKKDYTRAKSRSPRCWNGAAPGVVSWRHSHDSRTGRPSKKTRAT